MSRADSKTSITDLGQFFAFSESTENFERKLWPTVSSKFLPVLLRNKFYNYVLNKRTYFTKISVVNRQSS